MKFSTLAAGGKKEDEVPILPRFVSGSDSISIINLQDEKKAVKAEIEAVDQAKLVSGKRKDVMKDKKTSACQEACDVICFIIYYGVILVMIGLLGFNLFKIVDYYKNGPQVLMEHHNKQMEHHNNLVRYHVDAFEKTQTILAKQLQNYKNILNNAIFNLLNDVRTLKDSVKHIEEEILPGDDDRVLDSYDSHDVVPNYPDTSSPTNPMSEANEDSDDLQYDIDEDEEYPINYMMSTTSPTGSSPPIESTSQATQSQRAEIPDYYSEYYTEGTPALH